jgi:hypothetical protein
MPYRKVNYRNNSLLIAEGTKQDSNVRVRVTIVAMENQEVFTFRVCVCCLSYPACNAHAPFYNVILVCLALPCFSTLSHKRHDIRENVIEHKMCVLTFCTNFVWNICHSKKHSARYYHKCNVVVLYCFVMCVWGGGCNVCNCEGFVMCECFGNMYTVFWLRFCLTWLRFSLPWLRFFRVFSSVVRQMPG